MSGGVFCNIGTIITLITEQVVEAVTVEWMSLETGRTYTKDDMVTLFGESQGYHQQAGFQHRSVGTLSHSLLCEWVVNPLLDNADFDDRKQKSWESSQWLEKNIFIEYNFKKAWTRALAIANLLQNLKSLKLAYQVNGQTLCNHQPYSVDDI